MDEPGAPPRLTLAVVTWNSARHMPGLFASLSSALEGVQPSELIVADNNSSDRTLEVVRQLAPAARVIQLGDNRGYAAGINAAVAAASPSSEAVLILNPDVQLMPRSVGRLLDTLGQPGTGITVPRLLGSDGGLRYSLRRDPTVLRALGEAFLGGNRAGRVSVLGEVISDPRRYEHPCLADWATGAIMLISRECLNAVGPWDESYFLYSEETDYAWRARQMCYALRYVPDAAAVHEGGPSDERWTTLTVNRVRLFARRHGRLHGAAFRLGVILNEGLRALAGRRKHRAALRALLARALRPADA